MQRHVLPHARRRETDHVILRILGNPLEVREGPVQADVDLVRLKGLGVVGHVEAEDLDPEPVGVRGPRVPEERRSPVVVIEPVVEDLDVVFPAVELEWPGADRVAAECLAPLGDRLWRSHLGVLGVEHMTGPTAASRFDLNIADDHGFLAALGGCDGLAVVVHERRNAGEEWRRGSGWLPAGDTDSVHGRDGHAVESARWRRPPTPALRCGCSSRPAGRRHRPRARRAVRHADRRSRSSSRPERRTGRTTPALHPRRMPWTRQRAGRRSRTDATWHTSR